ncbi:tyrosine-protein phosphatase [Amycolatopsis sp. A133]|uniref:tyrosine-protein phosphatase n=1 Tax=Amycolatopsis sp. A133 TaxID=3064472 RepID=UPI0027EF15F5|nr:tyrosine-protein phosphatase [Amycolatopsis sp. A133]MDQ7803525.1 tyrosine-protein phosphatase [Amycolatopsis sp. A133]
MNATSRRTFVKAGCAAVAAGFVFAENAGAASSPPAGSRVPGTLIPIEGALNVRDVGGYRTVEGATVRCGQVYRSGTLAYLTPLGLSQLAALGLKEVVDFRTAAELTSQGPDRLPAGVVPISTPIGETAPPHNTGAATTAAVDPALLDIYRGYVDNDSWRKGFGRTLQRIASAAERPLTYHDSAGAHRSGWLTAVLLTLLGVDKDTVYAEYLRSNDALGGIYAYPEYLDEAFAEATRKYGSFTAFLVQGLELSLLTILRIRTGMLTLA